MGLLSNTESQIRLAIQSSLVSVRMLLSVGDSEPCVGELRNCRHTNKTQNNTPKAIQRSSGKLQIETGPVNQNLIGSDSGFAIGVNGVFSST